MAQSEKSYKRGEVVEIIHSVINKIDEPEPSMRTVHSEIGELVAQIDRLKNDIAEHRANHLNEEDIPEATDELDEVVSATAEATNAIMAACEEIENIADQLDGDHQTNLTNLVTQIYEACGFQDITGQRITKVVTTLRAIDDKVAGLMDALNKRVGPIASLAPVEKEGDSSLLNGPQMAEQAVTQADIDKLLAEFD